MNIATVLIITEIFLIVAFVLIKRRSKSTGGDRYTSTRVRGGQREVYDDDTGAWVLMTLVTSDLDFDHEPYTATDNSYSSPSYSSDYSSSDSSSYDSGSSYSSGGDSGGCGD